MPSHDSLAEIVTFLDFLPLKYTLNHPSWVDEENPLVLHYHAAKYTQKLQPFVLAQLSQNEHLPDSQSLLS